MILICGLLDVEEIRHHWAIDAQTIAPRGFELETAKANLDACVLDVALRKKNLATICVQQLDAVGLLLAYTVDDKLSVLGSLAVLEIKAVAHGQKVSSRILERVAAQLVLAHHDALHHVYDDTSRDAL